MPNTRYQTVIGLEVHCQLATRTKLFCSCPTSFGALPNHNTCAICLGHPGTLPVVNTAAVDYAIRFAIAVGAEIHQRSRFARKQYFYPDLPKGYQISQYDEAYCSGGRLKLADGFEVQLVRAHLEEDAGKNVHGDLESYVDLNRTGTPLLEIVTEPVIHSPEHATEYLKRLHALVRYLDISDGNMEEGSFRCDANVSIRPVGDPKLGARCEVKNLNSFKNIDRAIRYEVARQADLLDNGERVTQQTLLFDPAAGKTRAMRSKEDAQDYRYFPDPDLPPLMISAQRISRVANELPELPVAKCERFQTQYKLSEYDASLLTSERELADYFESVLKFAGESLEPKIAANWVTTEFLREMNEKDADLSQPLITPQQLGGMLRLLADDTISGKIAKKLFRILVDEGGEPETIVKEKGLIQVSDVSAIEHTIATVLDENPAQVADYLSGKEKVLGYFVGQIMRVSGGKLNPTIVNEKLREKLNERKDSD